MTDCTPSTTLSRKLKKRSIHINFDGGHVSGIAGVELLRAADDHLGLCQAAAKLLPDPRNQDLVTHDWLALFRQRTYAIGAGFADLNDHAQLRLDAALQSAVGVLEPMASAPTLCRLEAVAAQQGERGARRTVFEMHRLILAQLVASFDEPPTSLILDFDGTDDRVHGEQEGRAYNSHYGGYGFFPLYVYSGEKLLVSYLRPINRPDAYHSAAVLSLLVKGLRAHWPDVNIVFWGDAGFYRPLLLSWCERHNVRYIVGFSTNAKLLKICKASIDYVSGAWELLERKGAELECFKVFQGIDYQTGTWRRARHVIAKIERNPLGGNQRFIVTDLPGDAEHLYSDVYCERGTMENRHKE